MFTGAVVVAALGLLLFSSLHDLTHGKYASAEVQTAISSASLGAIIENPVNLPYKAVGLISQRVIGNDVLAMRATSALFGFVVIGLFYVVVRQLYSARVTFLITVALACSSWFLHTARFGTADIVLPAAILLLGLAAYWVSTAGHSQLSYITAVLAIAIMVYVPGIIPLLAIGLLLRRKDALLIRRRLSKKSQFTLVLLACGLVLLPLAMAVVRQPSVLTSLLGLPVNDWPSVVTYLKNFLLVPLSIWVWSPTNAILGLGHLPRVDIFIAVMSLLGAYMFIKLRSLSRSHVLLAVVVASWILVALGGGVSIAVFMPLVFMLAATGIHMLLAQWQTVFPRNPYAMSAAVLLVSVAVTASCVYNLRSYYIAWPNAPETKTQFNIPN